MSISSIGVAGLFLKAFVDLLHDDEAQGLVEYALIVALVSVVAVVALRLLGHRLNNSLSNSANALL